MLAEPPQRPRRRAPFISWAFALTAAVVVLLALAASASALPGVTAPEVSVLAGTVDVATTPAAPATESVAGVAAAVSTPAVAPTPVATPVPQAHIQLPLPSHDQLPATGTVSAAARVVVDGQDGVTTTVSHTLSSSEGAIAQIVRSPGAAVQSQLNDVKQAGAAAQASVDSAVRQTGAAAATTLTGATHAADQAPPPKSGSQPGSVGTSSSAAAGTVGAIAAKRARTTTAVIASTLQSPTRRVAVTRPAGEDTPAGPGSLTSTAGASPARTVAARSAAPAATPVDETTPTTAACGARTTAGAFLLGCAGHAVGAMTLLAPVGRPPASLYSLLVGDASSTQDAAHRDGHAPAGPQAPAAPQAPIQGPAGLVSAAGTASSGFAFSILLSLLGLLLLGVPRAMRRLGLASDSLSVAPFVLIPDRPG